MQLVTPGHVGQHVAVLAGGRVFVGQVGNGTSGEVAVLIDEHAEHRIAQRSIAVVTVPLDGPAEIVERSIAELLDHQRAGAAA
jgi:hypothetical protein